MSDTNASRISELRGEFGQRLVVLGHHYQNDKVIRHADYRGDSLELSRRSAKTDADYIIFCGVYFMAETSAILAKETQKVFIPDETASCSMSDSAPHPRVSQVIDILTSGGRKIIPLAYVNSSARVKAICGRLGGSVCTSANAKTMLAWAMKQGDGVIFLPDRNLGLNTADTLGIPESARHVLDVRELGGRVDKAAAAKASLLLWPGSCCIHARFKPEHIEEARRDTPGCKVIVHPECKPEVVALADASGSTSRIISYVRDAAPGSTIYVGTEINLVMRLAKEYEGVKSILPLSGSACRSMGKITEAKLLRVLEHLDHLEHPGRPDVQNGVEPVAVGPDIRAHARVALDRMLQVCS